MIEVSVLDFLKIVGRRLKKIKLLTRLLVYVCLRVYCMDENTLNNIQSNALLYCIQFHNSLISQVYAQWIVWVW